MCFLVASSCPRERRGAKWSTVEETNRLTFSRLSFALPVSVVLLFSVSCSYRNTRVPPSQFFFTLCHIPFLFAGPKKMVAEWLQNKAGPECKAGILLQPPYPPFYCSKECTGMMVASHDTDLDDANFPHLNSPPDGSDYRNDACKKILRRS